MPGLLWRSLAAPLGCALGVAGYLYPLAWTRLFAGGVERRLSPAERELMAETLAEAGIDVDLDRVRLRTGVSLRGIPGSPWGMVLGRTVHVVPAVLRTDAIDHMRLLLHELVHVSQFERLGRARFACRYGATIAMRLDTLNPLEREAYAVSDAATQPLRQRIAAIGA